MSRPAMDTTFEPESENEDGRGPDLGCDRTALWVRARVLGASTEEDDAVARAHIRTCATCRDLYRAQMADKARLGRAALRSSRGVDSGLGPAASPRVSPRHRRLLVVIALSIAIAGVVRMGGSLRPDPTLPIAWLEGELFVAGEPVGATFGPDNGLRGDLLQTGEDGRAEVRLDEGRVLVDPSTTLLVESAVAQRLRLVGGSVKVDGTGRLVAPFGVIEVESGAASVVFDGDRYTITGLGGVTRLSSALGEEELRAGEDRSGTL